jgi:hypothetical protein
MGLPSDYTEVLRTMREPGYLQELERIQNPLSLYSNNYVTSPFIVCDMSTGVLPCCRFGLPLYTTPAYYR